jgi:hypothetical protein
MATDADGTARGRSLHENAQDAANGLTMRDLTQTLAHFHDANIEIGEDPGPPTPWRTGASEKLYTKRAAHRIRMGDYGNRCNLGLFRNGLAVWSALIRRREQLQ